MRQAGWIAFWEWLPGVVGGGLPLLVFALASSLGPPDEIALHYDRGLVSHLLVMAMVTSSVSVITSFGRILTGKIPNILRDGRGPVLLIILSLIVMVYSTALYGFLEIGGVKHPSASMLVLAGWGLMASLVSSLYMEFAIARLHVLAKARRPQNGRGKGVKGSERVRSVVDDAGDC